MCFTATMKQVNYDSSWSDNNWGRFTALLIGVQQDFLSYLGKTSYQSCNSFALRYTYLSQAHWGKASKVSSDKWFIFLSLLVNKLFITETLQNSPLHEQSRQLGMTKILKSRWSAHLWHFTVISDCQKSRATISLNQPKLGTLNA